MNSLKKRLQTAKLDEIIRVNHAGEYGAKRIYQGQLSVLGENEDIKEMYAQELKHLEFFESEMIARKIRPTMLSPLWHFGGFLLGAVTARIGVSTAMACTEAVEEVIEEHYEEQLEVLPLSEQKLKDQIKIFQAEEIEHKKTAILKGAKSAKLYPISTAIIKFITKSAIMLSKKY